MNSAGLGCVRLAVYVTLGVVELNMVWLLPLALRCAGRAKYGGNGASLGMKSCAKADCTLRVLACGGLCTPLEHVMLAFLASEEVGRKGGA